MKVNFHATSIYEVPDSFFLKNKFKNVLFDLDNTLEPFFIEKPTQRVLDLGKRLKALGMKVYIVSNSIHAHRVKEFAKALLTTGYRNNCHKPLAFKIKKMMEKEGLDPQETVYVGDQLFTDCQVANKLKVWFLLTHPLAKREQFFTHFTRAFDLKKRRKLQMGRLLGQDATKI